MVLPSLLHTHNQQRMEQKNRLEGKNSSLNDSRLERLQMIGFRWAKRKGQASWNEKFNELVQYKARNATVTSQRSTRLIQPSDVGSQLNDLSIRGTPREIRKLP